MKTRFTLATATVVLGVVGSLLAGGASACSVPDFSQGVLQAARLQAAQGGASAGAAALPAQVSGGASFEPAVQAANFGNGQGAIVGMWLFTFTAHANDVGIPDGSQVDTGYQTWHSDGTELTNSGGRAPDTQAFCQGVWGQKWDSSYELNHWAIAWAPDPVTGAVTFLGPANIHENVKVDRTGNNFSGTFTIDQYVSPAPPPGMQPDLTNLSIHPVHITGTVTAKRISVN